MVKKNADLLAWAALVVLLLFVFPEKQRLGAEKMWDDDIHNPYLLYYKISFLVFALAIILYRRWRNK